MKAAVCREFGKPLVIEEVSLDPPGPGEVLVDVKACSICHSDIFYAEGAWGGGLPAVYGHEAAGIVRATGSDVATVRPGDRVVVTLIRSCGHCHYCDRQAPVLCEGHFALNEKSPIRGADGSRYVQAMATGAFAEQVVVHASQVVVMPDDIDFDVASLLACGVITGYGAVANTAKLMPGQSAAVIGCGGVGLNCIQAAAISGADPIVAVDVDERKIAAARQFGATHGVNPRDGDAVATLMALTHGRGADFVFVATGAKAAFDSAPGYMTRCGTIVVVGMPPSGVMAEYDPGTLAAWNQRILGSKMGDARIATDIPLLVEHYRSGRLKLDELISGRYRLDQVNEAIAAVNAGSALRNVIIFE